MNARQEFDYVIVGAGSAGCVLAARLSQDPNVRVVLVEAGGPDDMPEIAPFDHALTMTTTILEPTSRGRVVLRSARPDAKPRIYHNYLATDHDRATLIASVRLAMDLFTQPNLSKVKRAPFSVPASDAEADIVAFIEQRTGTNYHPTCTCAIGRVVDSDLRVFGTEGLRVSDASVMPSIVRGNTNAAVIAIAEKAADILLGNEPASRRAPPAVDGKR
jgi:choline dehydrogenase